MLLPCPPLCWSSMLSCVILRNSSFSGAPFSSPQPLVWSNDGCPRTPGTIILTHWPFQLGYFDSSNACAPPIVVSSAAACTRAQNEPRKGMAVPLVMAQGKEAATYKVAPLLGRGGGGPRAG